MLFKQFIGFGIVGLVNTVIYFVVYYTLLSLNFNYIIAYVVGFLVSIFNAYYWNNKYVFKKSTEKHFKPLFRTFCAYGSTFVLSLGLLVLMVDYLYISQKIAPILTLLFTVPINFLLNKLWAFK